jgi:hypothetical protein
VKERQRRVADVRRDDVQEVDDAPRSHERVGDRGARVRDGPGPWFERECARTKTS